ncbi:MAG: hypothetical protein PHU99_03640 [Candidatus Cloacimonetes bacterium]|jgi:hypothetical protein|nr:hypothetical protein [Candidatus Cloacimonadota bacterium]MDY0336513.1 hypothetical protein [Candidatus Cloacimonadaceae bacterium]MCB5268978.1 hypothetical protein [Candidatus Cloacimonadota bacterium]MCK9333942.1 hypothetical protein [Candidatus Cloacimonadota bacterium]MDD2542952.1 hypothetical protein [Candidatus Cloacimonadota bacterium]
MPENNHPKTIGGKGIKESLSHEQRKELMSLMKRMLPPVPSLGIIDIRFSFWFIRNWYIVFIFGRDTRNQFKSLDKGDMNTGLTTVAKAVTYVIMVLFALILLMYALYLLKSLMGIDLYPDTHLLDIIRDKLSGGR